MTDKSEPKLTPHQEYYKSQEDKDCQHLILSQSNDLSTICLHCGKRIPPPPRKTHE